MTAYAGEQQMPRLIHICKGVVEDSEVMFLFYDSIWL